MVATTVLHELERRAATEGSLPAYRDRLTGTWRTATWSEYNAATRRVARALVALGLERGEVVTILGANRPEWALGALGAMRIGAVAAGIYATDTPEEVAYIVGHSKSRVIIVENAAQLDKVLAVWEQLPGLTAAVRMDGTSPPEHPRVHGWEAFLALGDHVTEAEIDHRLDQLGPDDLADLIYTSGTTGPPKAVMLTHDNLRWTGALLGDVAGCDPSGSALSYLPLSHIAEQMSSMHVAIMAGYPVSYCPEPEKLTDYLIEVQPAYFFGVPRVWERMAAGVAEKLEESTGLRALVTTWARRIGGRVVALENAGEETPSVLRLQFRIAHKLVFSKVRAALGMDRTVRMISAAAPIPVETLEFFASLGMGIIELYGQSEDSGPTTANLPGATRFGTVGRPLPGVEVRLDAAGEILVRGRNVFAGYLHDPEATARTLDDGWLRSGDLGSLDTDGYLRITGRVKDIIITSGGKNIAPRNIEAALRSVDLVSQAVCVGDRERYLIALLTIDPEALGRFATSRGVAVAGVADPIVRGHLEEQIRSRVNPRFARVEHIRNFAILPHDFTVDNGELTPTLKVRRAAIIEKYHREIVATYAEGQRL